ncbi:MAG: NAD-dependent epimerase/dehydratase family protein [Deltaproteobacteria bacterium]|nr:NAD-dependent epimerase/dehydratase family protein [Deltaproteobacteria bacterium]
MKVAVTGANGHIGAQVTRALVEAGHEVAVLLREGSDRRGLAGLEVQEHLGDILDPGSLEAAFAGAEVVFHLAAAHLNHTKDPADIERPAVEGTRNVVAAARAAGVRRLVHTSTGATVGFAKDPERPLDERHRMESAKSSYIRGKIVSEREALAASGDELEVVVLNPSGVFGPFDHRLTPATRSIIDLLQGGLTFFSVCFTDVRDVARAHLLAAERGRAGERYLITGEQLAPPAIAALYEELGGTRPPTLRPPAFLAKFVLRRLEKKAEREGIDAPASADSVDDLDGGHLAYDARKSREELGMTYRPAREVLTDTFRWLLFVDALKPKVAAKVRAALGEAASPDPGWRH